MPCQTQRDDAGKTQKLPTRTRPRDRSAAGSAALAAVCHDGIKFSGSRAAVITVGKRALPEKAPLPALLKVQFQR